MSDKSVKKRNWAFILYPDSAPDEWLSILQQTGLSGAVSPLHDRDVNATGEPKKPHYHVILCYPGPTTYNAVKKLTLDKLGQTIPQPIEGVKGYYRYLTHQDNPEKAQYDAKDIVAFNGFNILEELSKSEIDAIKSSIQSLVRGNDITEYADLMDLLQDSDMVMEYGVASSNTLFFDRYISSRRHKKEGKPDKKGPF